MPNPQGEGPGELSRPTRAASLLPGVNFRVGPQGTQPSSAQWPCPGRWRREGAQGSRPDRTTQAAPLLSTPPALGRRVQPSAPLTRKPNLDSHWPSQSRGYLCPITGETTAERSTASGSQELKCLVWRGGAHSPVVLTLLLMVALPPPLSFPDHPHHFGGLLMAILSPSE